MSKIKVNPIAAKLAKAKQDKGVVEIEGYIGSEDGGVVRVYKSLKMATCWDIPKNAIHHVADPETPNEPAKLFVSSDVDIKQTTTQTIKPDSCGNDIPRSVAKEISPDQRFIDLLSGNGAFLKLAMAMALTYGDLSDSVPTDGSS